MTIEKLGLELKISDIRRAIVKNKKLKLKSGVFLSILDGKLISGRADQR